MLGCFSLHWKHVVFILFPLQLSKQPNLGKKYKKMKERKLFCRWRNLLFSSMYKMKQEYIARIARFAFVGLWSTFNPKSVVITSYREEWMIYRGPGFLSVVWLGSSTTPFPFSRQKVASLSQSSCVCLIELSGGRARMGWARSRSEHRVKACPSINHLILSGFLSLCVGGRGSAYYMERGGGGEVEPITKTAANTRIVFATYPCSIMRARKALWVRIPTSLKIINRRYRHCRNV